MVPVLTFLFVGLVAFMAAHYTTALFAKEPVLPAIVGGVFGVLCAIFLSGVVH